MTLVFENDLVAPTLTLAIAYFLLSIYACRRLISLHKTAPEMNTRKLFVMTCLLTTILRLMTFGSMTAFNYAEFHLKVRTDIIPTGDDIIVTDAFFEKATLVLLDVPDWCCISAYVLLIVICAEALLQSRRHWLSSFEFRRTWILGYLVFNALLYAVQVSLYSLMFMPSINQEILGAFIYLTLTFFNLGLPVVWVLGLVFLSVRFSGFPYSSVSAKNRLNSLVRLGSIWTVARLSWGFIALTSVMQDWLVMAQKSVQYYSLVLISVFFFAEILPIAFSLQNNSLESLTEKPTPLEHTIGDVTPNWEEKMISRGPRHANEYSSISKGDEHQGRGAGGPGPGPGPGFQGSYQRDEEGGHGSSARKHPVLALTSPSNGQAEGYAGNATAVRQSQRNSPFLHQGYFSNPSQEGNGPRTVSKYSEGDTQQYRQQNHLPPYDTEYDTENGVESQERRGRGPRRSGMTGRGISIDSTMSCYSDTSSVTVRDDCYSSNLPSIDSDLSTLHNNHSSTQELQSGRGGIGLLIYDPDRKWGSWLGL